MSPPLTALERLLDALIESGSASAAVALVGGGRRVEWSRAAGAARSGPPEARPAAATTWFDYGSLTKPFVATAALALDRTGELPLGTRIGEVLGGADRRLAALPLAGGGPFALGWWRRRHRGGGGPALSAGAFGHTGFAGGSLWIDPRQSRIFVLLAHRTHPAVNMNRWRRRFHAAATRALPPADPTP
jgi:CubicO group peptidase (beta-lactamase class C family)